MARIHDGILQTDRELRYSNIIMIGYIIYIYGT